MIEREEKKRAAPRRIWTHGFHKVFRPLLRSLQSVVCRSDIFRRAKLRQRFCSSWLSWKNYGRGKFWNIFFEWQLARLLRETCVYGNFNDLKRNSNFSMVSCVLFIHVYFTPASLDNNVLAWSMKQEGWSDHRHKIIFHKIHAKYGDQTGDYLDFATGTTQ